MKTKDNLVKCTECNGTDVEFKTWYNPNLEVVGDDCIFDDQDTYCNTCQNHTKLKF